MRFHKMAKDLDASTKTLGTFFCIVLIAYIFYFLGSRSNQIYHNVYPAACDRPCCRQVEVSASKIAERIEDEKQDTLLAEREAEVRALADEARRVEIRMKLSMAKWDDERKLEMKSWREEQIRWLWERKKKEEKGILGWFGVREKKEVKK